MSNITRYESKDLLSTLKSNPQWGKANDKRGVKRTTEAMQFVKDYPIGSVLSANDLDVWLQNHGMLTIPAEGVSKTSDAWLGHLQRRHIIRNQINKAATHPRLLEQGSTPFSIDALAGGFEIRAPYTAIRRDYLPGKVESLVRTKKKQLAYLMQSTDWAVLSENERFMAESIFDEIQRYADHINFGTNQLDQRFAKLQRHIEAKIQAGLIVPTDEGIKQLLAAPSEELEAETDYVE